MYNDSQSNDFEGSRGKEGFAFRSCEEPSVSEVEPALSEANGKQSPRWIKGICQKG